MCMGAYFWRQTEFGATGCHVVLFVCELLRNSYGFVPKVELQELHVMTAVVVQKCKLKNEQ